MVVSEEALATAVAVDVLKKGGNAIDAAAALAYSLAVTLPKAGNLGGGGFMLVYIKAENKVYALDYREKAPLKAHRDLFLNPQGQVSNEKSRHSILSTAVPGTVAGIEAVHQRFGSLPRKDILKPAIRLAKQGIPVSYELAQSLKEAYPRFSKHQASTAIFYPKNKAFYEAGDLLVQRDLSHTLEQLLKKGPASFYEGDFAKKLLAYSQEQSGIITQADLSKYKPVWRQAVTGSYRDYDIVSMPPPSSGGIALIQAFNILEQLAPATYGSADSIHSAAETLHHVYKDRALHLGDSDFVSVPIHALTDKRYAQKLAETISTSSRQQASKEPVTPDTESTETTHFVIVDKFGNAVSNTYTLNFSYGNAQVVPGTGVLLNNEMDDFSAKPGVPNAYGLIGNEKNAIAPEKRMLSSMTPTIVFKEGDLFLVSGSPGGSRIITTVLQVIRNVIDYDMTLLQATASPRFHFQWKPDILFLENGFSADTVSILENRGFSIKKVPTMGAAESILVKEGYLFGAADPRKPGSLASGY